MSEVLFFKILVLVFIILLVHSIRLGTTDIKNWLDLRPSKIKLPKKKAGFYTGVGNLATYQNGIRTIT